MLIALRVIGVALAFALSGCNGGGLLRGSGVETAPPGGFVTYCGTYPERKECGGTK